jgi:plasmid stabilization system protein ParE
LNSIGIFPERLLLSYKEKVPMANPENNTIRRELHALLDHIPDNGVSAAREYLRSLVDPVELALLNAPDDDEPLTEHERAAMEAAERRKQSAQPVVSHEEILREFGLNENSR